MTELAKVEITIRGMGGFELEPLIIKEALEREGLTVQIQNEYPEREGLTVNMLRAERVEWLQNYVRYLASKGKTVDDEPYNRFNISDKFGGLVVIKVEHLPWGG